MSASFVGTDKVISGSDDRYVKLWDVSHCLIKRLLECLINQ